MSTLLLTRKDVVRHLEALWLLSELREAFRVQAAERGGAEAWSASTALHETGRAGVRLAGRLAGIPGYTVQVMARHEGRTPGWRRLLHLYDLESGELLAIMEAEHLLGVCSSVVGALAADVLARQEASRVALLGAGPRAALQLKSLRLVRSLTHVRVYDQEPERAVELAPRLHAAVKLPVRAAFSVSEAVEDADVIVCSPEGPGLEASAVPAGAHVSVQGEEQVRREVAAGHLRQARCIWEDGVQALELARAGEAGLEPPQVELGQVLAGQRPGRDSGAEVTVYYGLGLPWQDLVAAWHVYQGALTDDQVQRVDFEG